MEPHQSDPYALQQRLRLAARHGTRAAMLLTYHRALIDALVPPEHRTGQDSGESLGPRAIYAEQLIRTAIAHIGGQRARALEIVLDLRGEGSPLEQRREEAAQVLGVAPVTFRRSPRYEHLLLLELSVELCRLSISDSR